MANEQEDKAVQMGQLIARRMAGRLLPHEERELADWLAESVANRQLYADLLAGTDRHDYLQDLEHIDDRAAFREVRERYDQGPRRRPVRRWLLPYAAAMLLIASVVGYFAVVNQQSLPDGPGMADIAPGGNRATLTLADGRTIDLSQEQAGIIVGDGITYLDGSTVLGERVNMGTGEPVEGPERNHQLTGSQAHTLTTPKGGQYQVTLPDGSKVWLNSASKLTYPSTFPEDERVVHLTGEAYFDINEQALTRSPAHPLTNSQGVPFKVVTNGQTVEVLGTEFNISAYPDEPETKTTLVEGKVKVVLGTQSELKTYDLRLTTDDLRLTTKILTPGQQAITRGAATTVHAVDTEPYTSWKEGVYVLNNGDLRQLTRQLERWYDVEFVIDERLQRPVSGIIPRNANLSEVLQAMENNTGLTFTLNERRVMVAE